jgi:hypothetical protein
MTITGMTKKRPKGILKDRFPDKELVPLQTQLTIRVPV